MVKTKKEFVLDGITYFYSVEADTRNPGKYIYGLQVFVDGTVSSGSDFSSSISETINGVVSELQKEISELQNSAAIQQRTLARLEEQLQNPNLTPAERAALQDRIDDFKVIIAETQAAIAGTQRAIAEVQKSATGIFQEMQKELEPKLVPPAPTPTITNTTAPAATPATAAATNNSLQGTASDDSGAQPTTPTSTATTAAGADGAATGPASEPSVNAPAPPETARENAAPAASTQGTPPYENEEFDRKEVNPRERPGKRLNNPLGSLSSYTYQLSLYMVSPDAYDAFIASGRRNLNLFNEQFAGSLAADQATDLENRGVFLVAQSGGSSPTERTSEFKYDYYIDDLSFKSLVNAKETAGPTGNIEFTFKITEPYGFSLISKASDTHFFKESMSFKDMKFIVLCFNFF